MNKQVDMNEVDVYEGHVRDEDYKVALEPHFTYLQKEGYVELSKNIIGDRFFTGRIYDYRQPLIQQFARMMKEFSLVWEEEARAYAQEEGGGSEASLQLALKAYSEFMLFLEDIYNYLESLVIKVITFDEGIEILMKRGSLRIQGNSADEPEWLIGQECTYLDDFLEMGYVTLEDLVEAEWTIIVCPKDSYSKFNMTNV